VSDPALQPVVGQTIASYKILEKLGAGGMGVVYKAFDTKLSRPVALKFLTRAASSTEHARNELIAEARAASALDHPNIGTIYGIEEGPENSLFLVMAYYEGETLSQRIAGRPLTPAESASIAAQAAAGLAEAHARHVVHRDIKPSNIIITSSGLVKIVDFGLARVISSASSTQTGLLSGTVFYMSPEQAEGRMIDHRTDLWSLGAILYEMVTGQRPFEARSAPATLYAVVHSPPKPMDDIVPGEIQRIIYRALAKNPQERYQGAQEMAQDLKACAGVDPTPSASRPPTAREISRYRELASHSGQMPPARRLGWAAKTGIGGLIAVAAIGLSLLYPPVRERLMPSLAGPRQRHIAVLPFSSIGNDPADSALADGLLESLTGRLSNLEVGNQSLWVVPASEVRRRKIADAPAALKELGANLVITGAVQRQGDSVRLTVNLIETRDLRQIGSGECLDRTGDFSALQDTAVAKLANLMKINVTAEMLHNTGGAVRPAAYESYLKALGYLQRFDKKGNIDEAIKLLDAALRDDPAFALGFGSLGEAYVIKYLDDKNPRWLEIAEANCKHAIELNDHLAPVFITMGRLFSARGQNDLALDQYQRALNLEPHNADAITALATMYESQGRIKEAEENYRRAAALRPEYWNGYSKLGIFYFNQRRYPEAVEALKHVIELTPDNAEGYSNLGVVYRRMTDLPKAAAMFEKAIALGPQYRFYSNLGLVYHDQGNYTGAVQMFEKAATLNAKDFRLWMNLASAERWLGHDDKAIDAYHKALPLVEEMTARQPQDPTNQSTLGVLYARLGQREKAMPHVDASLAQTPNDPNVLERAAGAYEAIGDRRRAVEFLMRAVKAGDTIESIKHNPELRAVTSDPNFKPNTSNPNTK
jgi:serine/threonine protein kinase/tetratricopeptide (TPR) repeat protein